MKKILLFFAIASIAKFSYCQVGIGTTTPAPSSMLEVSSTSDGGTTYKGFMPPRVPNIPARNSITPNVSEAGLLVYVMNNGNGESCLQIWDGGVWNNIYCSTIPSPEIWINEFHYKNIGSDVGEFIEIAGPAGYDLSICTIELYNGTTGTVYESFALTGIIPNQSNGIGTLSFPVSSIQNGPEDGIAIVKAGLVIQFLSYEGILTPNTGAANGITSTDIGVEESKNTTPAGYSLQLTGTGNEYGDFIWNAPAAESPGTLNVGQIIN
ncbi:MULTISPECIES: hypothetical protein [Aequorivita]|uniref:Uncharacterized protein n=1 Tax=Aequorivita iocasae TaxID=2803865 RepID=A0ABX7DRX1_9FLAO|nr:MULTISPECIES: hypothetical protein [Aequorivita]QQX76217.1 hypothetical protein JK629_12880 [Aequorivita iocasae]UCA55676.1 hypothetical protein LDL78_12940 [Aequorivita sp. F7]